MVSGSVVNYLSTRSATPGALGAGSWFGENASSGTINSTLGGAIHYPLAAGDISAGTVTLQLRYDQASAGNKTLYASTANAALIFAAQVLTPANP
jgi:hypothetical protein